MKGRLLMVVALGAALVALPAAALGSNAHAQSNSQTYPDSIGEDPLAPDITSIQVSNDDNANITFKVNISNRPAFTSDMEIDLFLDTDQNPATGDSQLLGADYIIQLLPGQVGVFQWNGTGFFSTPSSTTLTYAYDPTGATIHINASDLGGTKGFNFGVDAISGITVDAQGNPDYTNVHDDLAPDPGHGFFNYKVIVQISLTQTAFTTSPSPAKAGKRFSASLAANESDTSGPVASGTVTCSATVGGKRLPATHSLTSGIASCFWKLPKSAKGKTLHGKVTINSQGATLSKSFAVKVH